MNETILKRPVTEGFPISGTFWMDHIIAGHEYEGDYQYTNVNALPSIGSTVSGFYNDADTSKQYIFRVIAVCLYEVEVRPAIHSKSIGAILIDPVMPSDSFILNADE